MVANEEKMPLEMKDLYLVSDGDGSGVGSTTRVHCIAPCELEEMSDARRRCKSNVPTKGARKQYLLTRHLNWEALRIWEGQGGASRFWVCLSGSRTYARRKYEIDTVERDRLANRRACASGRIPCTPHCGRSGKSIKHGKQLLNYLPL